MKLLALVTHGAAVALCSTLPMITDTKAAPVPGSDASSVLQARASDFGPNAPEELFNQAVKATKAANAPSLKPNRWYYFMSCGLPENTQAGSKDGITFIKPRPPREKGLPPRPETKIRLRAQQEEQVWKNAQQQVKEQTGCDHVGFVFGKVMKTSDWPWSSPEPWTFSAELNYVEPYSASNRLRNNDLMVAKWQKKSLDTAKVPGDLKLIYGGMTTETLTHKAADDFAMVWTRRTGELLEHPEENEFTFYQWMAKMTTTYHNPMNSI